MQAEQLVSDNLIAALSVRSDAMLTGSFLWPKVFSSLINANDAQESDLKQIIRFEENLLAEFKPTVNCIEDIYMPYLDEHCSPNPVGWFTEKSSEISGLSENPKVLFSIGATGASLESFAKAFEQIPNTVQLFGDEKIASHVERVERFSFEAKDFHSLDAIICRPGIGILTDAITYGVPVLMLFENDNAEMLHNALQAEKLGMGLAINLMQPELVPEMLERILEEKTAFNYAERARINGADDCANAILKNL